MSENAEERLKITVKKFFLYLSLKAVQNVQVISWLFWNHISFLSILIKIFPKGIKLTKNIFLEVIFSNTENFT
jgi:hypothetical protein